MLTSVLRVLVKNPLVKKVFMEKEKKKKQLGSVWYMCLKTENCYLKTFVEIRVGEKVRGNA